MSDSKIYFEALLSSLKNISFDNFSGKSFSFEKLFYPLIIDEGKYAFHSYEKLMERARAEQTTVNGNTQSEASQKNNKSASMSEQQKSLLAIESIVKQVQSSRMNSSQVMKDKAKAVFAELNRVTQHKKSDDDADSAVSADKISSFAEYDATDKENNSKNESETKPTLLELEPVYGHSTLVIDTDSAKSRILAVASAGHGKTTLLKRIAVFYCRESLKKLYGIEPEYVYEHELVRDIYSLPEKALIPCIILLRSIDRDFNIENAINKSIADVIGKFSGTVADEEIPAIADSVASDAINKNNLLLLVDGLDELSVADCKKFLKALQVYLIEKPDIKVLITSRVAGVSAEEIIDILEEMDIRGRSIIPLNDIQVEEYSEKWIDETQPEDFRASMKDALEQILHQDRFAYLKEFMRTPLELMFVLNQISGNSLSLDRYQMFSDMLWSMFTNHESGKTNKQYKFEDYMTFLSFIAYRLQLNNKLSFSADFLKELEYDLKCLSFYDKFIGENVVEDCVAVLDELAANVGIIESDIRDNEKIYTFTIRSYHEFLTAYACCHLRLDINKSRPDPQSIIVAYLNDSTWINIINFMLSDLYKHSKSVFDSCLDVIFKNKSDPGLLKAIIEANHTIGMKQVEALCENSFGGTSLDAKATEFLTVCLKNNIASSCLKYLKYFYNRSTVDREYLNAAAIASVAMDLNKGKNAVTTATEYLSKTTQTGEPDKAAIILGVEIIDVIVKICFDESDIGYSDKKEALRDDLKNEGSLAKLLYNAALSFKSFNAVAALTDLWILKIIDRDTAETYLNDALLEIVADSVKPVLNICIRSNKAGIVRLNGYLLNMLAELFTVLGSFPFSENIKNKLGSLHIISEEYADSDVVDDLFNNFCDVSKIKAVKDIAAVAIASYYCCFDKKAFNEKWRDVISSKKESVRAKNHYELERYVLLDYLKSSSEGSKTAKPKKNPQQDILSQYGSMLYMKSTPAIEDSIISNYEAIIKRKRSLPSADE